MVSHGRNYCGGSGVHVVHEAVGSQGIRMFGENTPYAMVTQLVKEV